MIDGRFWSKVDKSGDCWRWIASINSHGYGQLSRGRGKSPAQAHRVAFELAKGPIPEGSYVLHRCDNRRCVNPAHLFLGTHADNMADMKAKGRARGLSRPGEKNPQAKLTMEQAREVRQLCADGLQQRAVGRVFGITQRAVWAIVHGMSYPEAT